MAVWGPFDLDGHSLKDGLASNDLSSSIASARRYLEDIARRRLQKLATEIQTPLVRRRKPDEEAAFVVSEAGNVKVDIGVGLAGVAGICTGQYLKSNGHSERLYLYDVNDILEAVLTIRSLVTNESNTYLTRPTVPSIFSTFWSMMPLSLPTLNIEEFRVEFHELNPSLTHFGLDDLMDDAAADSFVQSHTEEGEKILLSRSARDARRYAKRGVPQCLRPAVWDLLIQSELTEDLMAYSKQHCKHLFAQVMRYDLLVDRVILQDVKRCQNDDTYFVFEDIVRDIMIIWSRDEWVHQRTTAARIPGTEGEPQIKGRWSFPIKGYPPNGVLPFCGVSSFAMIVAFLHSDVESAYFTFRELYVNHPFSLVTLGATFENLLKNIDAFLYLHLAHELGCPPLVYAFRWITCGFVGTLDIEQVLLLWDRIIAFNRPELLAAVAASIFLFRRESLTAAKGEKDIEAALRDLQMIKVIPLLQHCVWLKDRMGDVSEAWASNFSDDEE
ncbi:hypothetical protein HK101_008035 [Irineochytrium annulatum]|nr:hypothetical protein HK101_008035 [Irineochytrium annulatum]